MLLHQTLEKLTQMRLFGMLSAFKEQLENPQYHDLPFDERFGLIVDREFLRRENQRLHNRLKESRVKMAAESEDVDFQTPRGLQKSFFLEMSGCNWLAQKHNLIITGPTGIGKTYLASALARKACREGYRSVYYHFPNLITEISIAKADGSYPSLVARLAKRHLLVIDDWLRDPLQPDQSRLLLDLIDDRFRQRSTLLTSQLPIAAWHEQFQDATVADAILDRIVYDSYRLELEGGSMRKITSPLT
ncbi:MAG: IS21-like element helper ATPase IstB [Desulfotomaculaceae bacterium]|nr:IS21-like element helper ATPase IstB [Desulfotomaculaceae bacterium]